MRAKGKAFVDFQHDVTAEDVRLAHREGFVSVEHLKRYTTLGMATDQGKTSNMAGLAIMAEALGKPIPDVGTTRFRPPFSPVSIGSLAAERYGDVKPERLTPMHDWHVEHGATMYSAGVWYRPMIYGNAGETVEQAYVREAKAVRETAGIVDVSTLGKIAVQGPDARAALARIAGAELPRRMRTAELAVAGVDALVCGTGYTGCAKTASRWMTARRGGWVNTIS